MQRSLLRKRFGEKALEGPSMGASGQGGPEHTFFVAPSPLPLLFRFVVVSMGVSFASGVVGTDVVGAGLVLDFFLVLDAGGCSVMCAGIGAVTDFGVVAFVEAGVVAFAEEAVADLSSAFWGDFFFILGME